MNGFYMNECRTEGMSPSDIRDGMHSGHLSLCPYSDFRKSDTDDILDGFLYRTQPRRHDEQRCMSIMALGTNYQDIPVARIQTNCSDGRTLMSTPAVCTYCPQLGYTCQKSQKFDMYELLQDDADFNAAELAELLDDD